MKNKTVSQHCRISTILFWIGVGIVVISSFFNKFLQLHWTAWVGIAVFLSSFVYRIIFIKCPHCGSGLYGSRTLPKYCPDCGKALR